MAESDTTKLNLHNDVTVNGVRFKAGQNVEVPKKMADDIARIDYEHEQLKAGYMQKRVYEKDAGTMAVGGGAQ